MKEEHRHRRSFPWIETLLRDLSYGLASVRRAPGFSAVVVGVLALGIGANVGIFSVVDAVLFKPLPFAAPDRIAGVWEAPRPGIVNATTLPEFLEWKRLATVFEALSAEQSIAYEHTVIDMGAVASWIVRANALVGGTLTLEIATSDDGVTYSAWGAPPSAAIVTRYIKFAVTVAGALPIIYRAQIIIYGA